MAAKPSVNRFLDEAQGADILMVKPGMAYLDVLARIRDQTRLPLAVYQVERRIRDDQTRCRCRRT